LHFKLCTFALLSTKNRRINLITPIWSFAHIIRASALCDPYLRHAHRAPNSRESESNITKRMCRWHDSVTHRNAVLRFLQRKASQSLPATTKLQCSPILANHESCIAVTISSSSDSVPTRHNLSLLIISHAWCDLYVLWSSVAILS